MLPGSQHHPQSRPAALSPGAASSSPVPNSRRSQFVYTRANHNSVLGLGAYAAAAGAELVPQSDQGMEEWLASLEQQQGQGQAQAGEAGGPTFSLLAYPAEDNYAGVVFPLDWINRVSQRWGAFGCCCILSNVLRCTHASGLSNVCHLGQHASSWAPGFWSTQAAVHWLCLCQAPILPLVRPC